MTEKEKLKVLVISDTHTQHKKLKIPNDIDLLISCGDFTSFGKEHHVDDFNEWLGTLKHLKYKPVVVAGNHENGFKFLAKRLTNAQFLDQTEVIVGGWKIYGTKFFWKTVGNNPYYDMIPKDTDILITHQPPAHYFDGNYGCEVLLKRIQQIKPRLHLFGHIHMQGRKRGFGTKEDDLESTEFLNAAMCAEKDRIIENPDGLMIVNLDPNDLHKEESNTSKNEVKNEEQVKKISKKTDDGDGDNDDVNHNKNEGKSEVRFSSDKNSDQ